MATEGLRSIPANGWPEWDLSYVGKERRQDAGGTQPEIKKGRVGSAPLLIWVLLVAAQAGLRPAPTASSLQRAADGFYFCVVLQDFVAHFAAPAGLLVAAEWKGGVEDVVAIDPDCAGLQL